MKQYRRVRMTFNLYKLGDDHLVDKFDDEKDYSGEHKMHIYHHPQPIFLSFLPCIRKYVHPLSYT